MPRRKHISQISEEAPSTVTSTSNDPLLAEWEQHRNRHKLADLALTTIKPIDLTEEFEQAFKENQAQKLLHQVALKWRDKNRGRQRKIEQTEEGFKLAEKIFKSSQVPLGSYFGYISSPVSGSVENPEVISLEDGTFLSSNPPISNESSFLLGVTTPNGRKFYYHGPEPRLHPANSYAKFKLTDTLPFEVYCYDNTQHPLSEGSPDRVVLVKNREGEKFVRKRTEIDVTALRVVDEEIKEVVQGLQQPKVSEATSTKLFESYKTLKKQQAAIDLDYKEQLKAIGRTAKIEGDIFEPYCAQTILYTEEQSDSTSRKIHVDRILPYKGKNLEELLSPQNPSQLTSAHRLEIAKQCVALVCSLYDREHSLSKKGTTYSHGNIRLSHFCVSFKKDAEDKIVPEVSLIGFKEYHTNNAKPNRIHDGYLAPEAITHKAIPNSYRLDIYALGVVLSGFENPVEFPKRKSGERKRLRNVDLLAWRVGVEQGVLKGIDSSTFDEAQRRDYAELMMLSRQLKSFQPERRPALEDLKMAAGFCPALKALKEAIAHEDDPLKAQQLEQMAQKAVGIMKALAEYKIHQQEREEKPSLFRWLGFSSHNKSKKAVNSSRAILNATEVSVFNEELEKLMLEAQRNEGAHRNSFSAFLYKKLGENLELSSKEKRECKALVVELATKTKPSPESMKVRRFTDEEKTLDETVNSDESQKLEEKSRKQGFLRSRKVGISG